MYVYTKWCKVHVCDRYSVSDVWVDVGAAGFLSTYLLLLPFVSYARMSSAGSGTIRGGMSGLLSGVALRRGVNRVGRVDSFNGVRRVDILVGGNRVNSVLGRVSPIHIGTLRHITIRRSHLKVPLLVTHSIVRKFGAVFPVPLKRTTAFSPSITRRNTHITTIRTSSIKVH